MTFTDVVDSTPVDSTWSVPFTSLPTGLATVVTLIEPPRPLYERIELAESKALPDGAPLNVDMGTKVSPSAPIGIGEGIRLGWYNLLLLASNPP